MGLEELVRIIVSQVLQSLKEENFQQEKRNYQALVLFTGGKTGYQEAIKEVKKLQEEGWSFIFACSKGAEAIYGQELRTAFPGVEFLSEPLNVSPLEVQKKMDLVLIPVLSQNSLVKIALGLGDTLPTLLIKMALLLGKPILAASNAADTRYFCQQKGLLTPSLGLLQLMDSYLERLASFGIKLVEVQTLSRTAKEIAGGKTTPREKVQKSVSKRVVTGEDIREAAVSGQNILCPAGTLVTPMARDLARQYGVELIKVEKE